jgi:adenosine deaminase
LICIIQRILPVEEAEAVTQFAIDNKDSFVGLDLADNEVGFDSKPFAPFFQKAREAGLGITVHSGEADVPKAPRYVMDAIQHLGAQRIGHGLQIHRDETVMAYLRDNKIPLELCPTSNYLTNSISSIPEHPFRKLMEFGVPVTINTDDPGIFNIQLLGEYQLLVEQFALTEEELHHCNDNAARASFIDIEKKQKVWPRPID